MTRLERRRFVNGTSGGFTLIELLIVVAIIAVIASIAVPSLLKARMSADEASAMGSLRAVNSAQAGYLGSGGNGGYAVTLVRLATPCPNSSHGFIGPDLAADPALKAGYRVVLQGAASAVAGANDCNGVPTRTGYYLTATPISGGVTGRSAYASGSASVIFYDTSGVPPTEAAMAPGGGGQAIH